MSTKFSVILLSLIFLHLCIGNGWVGVGMVTIGACLICIIYNFATGDHSGNELNGKEKVNDHS